MKYSVSPTVKIHCWGGLGSQLLAVGLVLDLKISYPSRRLELVIHSSGVTRRVSEIDFLSSELRIDFVDDYLSKKPKEEDGGRNHIFRAQGFLKFVLDFFKIVITKDSTQFKLYPWTKSIRCHYGLTPISREAICFISKCIPETDFVVPKSSDFVVGVHFRSGDLLSKKKSSIIDLKIVKGVAHNLINELSKRNASLFVLSDSELDQNKELALQDFPLIWQSRDTWETFDVLLKTNAFIGTNSKVSLWVTLFRWALDVKGEVYLPKSLYEQFQRITNLPDEQKTPNNIHCF
jgi:hypothetical protein